MVPYEAPELAVEEIERRGDHPGFVQVMLGIRTSEPIGRRKYWPIYEAADAHGLPIGMHFGGQGGTPITGAGWPSFYLEDHAGMSTAFQAQVISLISEGVFERFPKLKIVLIEGGFAWLPPLAWRLDAAWRKLQRRGAAPQARAVRVLRRAHLAHHPADGGAAAARAVRRSSSSTRRGCRTG